MNSQFTTQTADSPAPLPTAFYVVDCDFDENGFEAIVQPERTSDRATVIADLAEGQWHQPSRITLVDLARGTASDVSDEMLGEAHEAHFRKTRDEWPAHLAFLAGCIADRVRAAKQEAAA
jgi:hypothetical protein